MTTNPSPTALRPRPAPTHAELESALEAYFYRAVRTAGGVIYKVAPTTVGLPDRLVALPGGSLTLVELKAFGGKPSPMQEHVHSQLAELGTTVVVLTGRSEINDWLRSRFNELEPRERRGGRRVKRVQEAK